VTASGEKFWTGAKRFPQVIHFDVKNEQVREEVEEGDRAAAEVLERLLLLLLLLLLLRYFFDVLMVLVVVLVMTTALGVCDCDCQSVGRQLRPS